MSLTTEQQVEIKNIFHNLKAKKGADELVIAVDSTFVKENFPGLSGLAKDLVLFKVFSNDKGTFISQPKVMTNVDGVAVVSFPDKTELSLPDGTMVMAVQVLELKTGFKYAKGSCAVPFGDESLDIKIDFSDKAGELTLKTLKLQINNLIKGKETNTELLYEAGVSKYVKPKKLYEVNPGVYTGLTATIVGDKFPKAVINIGGVDYALPTKAKRVTDNAGANATFTLVIPEDVVIKEGKISGNDCKWLASYDFYQEIDQSDLEEYC